MFYIVTSFCYHKNNAYISLLVVTLLRVMGVSGTRIGFFNIAVEKLAKYLIYSTACSPIARNQTR